MIDYIHRLVGATVLSALFLLLVHLLGLSPSAVEVGLLFIITYIYIDRKFNQILD